MTIRSTALIGGLSVLMVAGISAAPGGASRMDELGWLLGTWKRESRQGTAYEVWTRLGERVHEGRGFVVPKEGSERVPLEDLLLVEMGGDVFYISKVAENPYPVGFRLTSTRKREAVFENPQHDFPKKISYKLQEDGTLLAAIEGPGGEGGQPRRIEYRFVRD